MIDRRRVLLTRKSGGRLPSEYQEVEWIGVTSGNYIQTNIRQMDVKSVETQIRFISHGSTEVVFGNYSGGNAWYLICIRSSKLSARINFGTTLQYPYAIDTSKFYRIKTELASVDYGATFTVDDETYTTTDAIGYDTNLKSVLFALNRADKKPSYIDSFVTNARVKPIKIEGWEDALAEFVPCYRKSDGVIGMYDLCGSICPLTGTPFYINAGTGTFTKGADVN